MHQRSVAVCLALTGSAFLVGQFAANAGEGGTAGGSTDCASAPAASIGVNAFDTSASSASLTFPSSTSGGRGCGAHTVHKVNYFKFTPSQTATYTIGTCGAGFDTRLAVLSSCPSAGSAALTAIVACNDDACGYQSQLRAQLTAGTLYRIVVGGFASTDAGVGSITIAQDGSAAGPDVIVGLLSGFSSYGSVQVNGTWVHGYAIGTDSCNIGTAPLEWFQSPDNRHPFIPQNMYRYRAGRLEQIGMGWGKHGFTALQNSVCGTCTSSGTGTYLGVGCSDPYSSGLNGQQSGLGCRSEVNAASGVFPGTFNAGMPAAAATIGRRVQVARPFLDPALNAGSVYLAEAQYIAQDDARAGNANNNCSWRIFSVEPLSGGTYPLTFAASNPTQRGQPAIHAWKALEPGVRLSNVDVPSDGRLTVAHNVRDNGNGTWRYEYAIQNINSHRSANSFSVPIPSGVTVTNQGFKDIDYHSGDPYSPADWSISVADGNITWTGADFATAPNGNALRYATLYNFWFDADSAPTETTGAIGLFRTAPAGQPNRMQTSLRGPAPIAGRPEDLNGDGIVNGDDLGILLVSWGACPSAACPADFTADGVVNGDDLGILLTNWG